MSNRRIAEAAANEFHIHESGQIAQAVLVLLGKSE
jgi:hypothetical protein